MRAVRDCRLLEIDAERFGRLVEEDTGLTLSIAWELAPGGPPEEALQAGGADALRAALDGAAVSPRMA